MLPLWCAISCFDGDQRKDSYELRGDIRMTKTDSLDLDTHRFARVSSPPTRHPVRRRLARALPRRRPKDAGLTGPRTDLSSSMTVAALPITDPDVLVTLASLPSMSNDRLWRVLHEYHTWGQLCSAGPHHWTVTLGPWAPACLQALPPEPWRASPPSPWSYVAMSTEEFPPALKDLTEFPPVLWVAGDMSLLADPVPRVLGLVMNPRTVGSDEDAFAAVVAAAKQADLAVAVVLDPPALPPRRLLDEGIKVIGVLPYGPARNMDARIVDDIVAAGGLVLAPNTPWVPVSHMWRDEAHRTLAAISSMVVVLSTKTHLSGLDSAASTAHLLHRPLLTLATDAVSVPWMHTLGVAALSSSHNHKPADPVATVVTTSPAALADAVVRVADRIASSMGIPLHSGMLDGTL